MTDANDRVRNGEPAEVETHEVEPPSPPPPSPLSSLPTLGELSNGIDWFTVKPTPIPVLFTRQHHGRTVDAIPSGQVMILAAEGGAGKTFAAIGACLAVATGARWLGHFGVTQPGTAVALFGETSREVLWSRLQAVFKSMESTHAPLDRDRARERLRLLPLSGKPARLLEGNARGGADRTQHFDALFNELSQVADLRLVVVDTLARFGAPDCEVSQTLATETVTALEAIATLPSKPVVMALHHTSQQARQQEAAGKDAGTSSVRGVTALTDNARVVWSMSPAGPGELHKFVHLRSRKGNDIEASQDSWLLVRKEGGALYQLDDVDQKRYAALVEKNSASRNNKSTKKTDLGNTFVDEDIDA